MMRPAEPAVEQPTMVRPELQLDQPTGVRLPDRDEPTIVPGLDRPTDVRRAVAFDVTEDTVTSAAGGGVAVATAVTMRFGPGVPADPKAVALLEIKPTTRRRRRRRRLLLWLALLLALALILWWLVGRNAGKLHDTDVALTAPAPVTCNGTADVAARLTLNGKPGDITYRWRRNDGNVSPVEKERVAKGQRDATVHLHWTFEGFGHFDAVATVEVLTPDARTASVSFAYDCS